MSKDSGHLCDMLVAAREALEFAQGTTREEFRRDRVLQNAILRLVQIVDEAARRVSQQTREAHPEIPWGQIVGLRHRLVHEYFRINTDVVWDVVQDDLPGLVRRLETLLPPDDR
jgi:uncharacterized protein with HEPN domain